MVGRRSSRGGDVAAARRQHADADLLLPSARLEREVVTDAEQGVVHGLEPATWDGASGQVVLSAGFMGIHRYQFSGGRWQRTEVSAGDPAPWPKSGSSEVKVGHLGREQFVAAVEPWHGNEVVIYRDRQGKRDRRGGGTGVPHGPNSTGP